MCFERGVLGYQVLHLFQLILDSILSATLQSLKVASKLLDVASLVQHILAELPLSAAQIQRPLNQAPCLYTQQAVDSGREEIRLDGWESIFRLLIDLLEKPVLEVRAFQR